MRFSLTQEEWRAPSAFNAPHKIQDFVDTPRVNFEHGGTKNLRSYSMPVNLARSDRTNWMTAEKNLQHIPHYLDLIPYIPILTSKLTRRLRRADALEINAEKLTKEKARRFFGRIPP